MIGSIKKYLNSKFAPSDKDFEAKGVLTPQQFTAAGDQLTNFGWKWQASLTKTNKLLPDPNRQYLLSPATSKSRISKLVSQEILEMPSKQLFGFLEVSAEQPQQDQEKNYRQYTIYISYDEYYFTPRLWLKGNDIDGKPLNRNQIYEDIYAEYQNETVTEQDSPFMQCRMLTIHPCKHSQVLKKFIEESKQKGKMIKPHQALIIFLKFMSSIMPTIHYDQAIDIEI